MLRKYGRPSATPRRRGRERRRRGNGKVPPGVDAAHARRRPRPAPRAAGEPAAAAPRRARSGRAGGDERGRRRALAGGASCATCSRRWSRRSASTPQVVTSVDGEEIRGRDRGPGRRRRSWSTTAPCIEAVQHLAQRIVLRGAGGLRVIVDAAGYRGAARGGAAGRGRSGGRARAERGPGGRAAADAGGRAAVTCTSTCASAATSPRTARATSRAAASSSRRATEPLARFTFFLTVKQHPPALTDCAGWSALGEFDRGLFVGVLIGEGSFGGDGRQPHVTLRMHVRHEALFRWLVARFPADPAVRALRPRRPQLLPVDGARPGARRGRPARARVGRARATIDGYAAARLARDARALRRLLRPPRAVSAAERLAELAARYDLDAARRVRRWRGSSRSSRRDPTAPTTVRDPTGAVDVHLADSLSALELACVADARAIADLGSGAGFPGRRARVALPSARGRAGRERCAQVRVPRAAVRGRGRSPAPRSSTPARRSGGKGSATRDLVVARALASLAVICEYAAPLLARRRRARGVEGGRAGGRGAGGRAGRRGARARGRRKWSVARHMLAAWRTTSTCTARSRETPPGYPRRPGVAAGARWAARRERARCVRPRIGAPAPLHARRAPARPVPAPR